MLLGSNLYQRALLIFMHHLDYWESHNLPVFNLLLENVTFFSEESGEIAISILAQSLPLNHSGDLKDTQRYLNSIKVLCVLESGRR